MYTKVLCHQPFPRIKLEQVFNRAAPRIDKGAARRVPPDILNIDMLSLAAGLGHGVDEIGRTCPVLLVALETCEMDRVAPGQLPPARNQSLVNRVELIGRWKFIFHPV